MDIGGHMTIEELLGHIFGTVQTASLCLYTIAEGGADTTALQTSLTALHEEALEAFFWEDSHALRALHRELGGLARALFEEAHGREAVLVFV